MSIAMNETKPDVTESVRYEFTHPDWKSGKVSIWQAGNHDNPFGMRLTAYMISKDLADAAVPMSLLAKHPNVEFHYYRRAIGDCGVEMH